MALITHTEIRDIIGGKQTLTYQAAQLRNIEHIWPMVIKEMTLIGKNKIAFQVALLATIGVECPSFKPVREYPPRWAVTQAAKELYFNTKYGHRKDLGNIQFTDGYRYRGNGLSQLTGRGHHRTYGKDLGIPLEEKPELGLEWETSARIIVKFFTDHGLDIWAERAFRTDDQWDDEFCWRKIRRIYNGGYTHYKEFRAFTKAFTQAAKA